MSSAYERPERTFGQFSPETYRHQYEQVGYWSGSFTEECAGCGASLYVDRVEEDLFVERPIDPASWSACPVQVVLRHGYAALPEPQQAYLVRRAVRLVGRASRTGEHLTQFLGQLDEPQLSWLRPDDLLRSWQTLRRQGDDAWHQERQAELERRLRTLLQDHPDRLPRFLDHPDQAVRLLAFRSVSLAESDPLPPPNRRPRRW